MSRGNENEGRPIKSSRFLLALVLVTAWMHSDLPRFFGLPSAVSEARAAILEASSTAATTTTITTDVVMTGMTLTPGAGDYLVVFSTSVKTAAAATVFVSIYVNGAPQAHTERRHFQEGSIAGFEEPLMTYAHVSVGAGQAVEIRWRTSASTATALARTLNLFPVAAADVSQATATDNPTLNSATYTLLPGMTLSPAAGTYLALFSTSADGPSGSIIDTKLFVDGLPVDHTERSMTQEASIPATAFAHAILAKVTPAGGAVEVKWRNSGTAGDITAHQRTLTLYKVDAANIFEATATADTPSTTNTTDALLPDMTLTPGAGDYLAMFSSSFFYGVLAVDPVTFHSLYVNGNKVAHTERQLIHERSIDSTNIPVATNGVVSPGASQAVDVRWRSDRTNSRIARERTLVLLREAGAVTPATLSSAANQTFTVGQAATAASTLTVTDASTATITTANNLRIRIPATFNMTWDPTVTSVSLGGTASGSVSPTGLTYEDSNRTVVLDVTADFTAAQTLTIAGLKFTNFTAVSAADNLELVVAGAGGATAATDDKTITIVAAGAITAEQSISGCVAPGAGAVTIGTIASASGPGGNSTLDVTGVNLSGQNAVVVFVGYNNRNLETVTSVVIDPGGANQTSMGAALATTNNVDDARIYVYGLVNPPQGTFTIRVTFSAALVGQAGSNVVVYPLSGVDTAAAFGTPGTNLATSATGNVSVPSAAGELVLAGLAGETIGVSTVASPAVEDRDISSGASTFVHHLATAHQDGAAPSVNFSWSHLNDHWVAAGVSVKPGGGTTSLTLPSWTPQAGELLLVGIAMRDETILHSVSGNGLTWTLVADRDNDRGQMGVALYRASGPSPTAGSIVVTLTGNTLPAYAVAVRLSGVDTAVNQGIEAVATASGPAGVDDANMKVTVTTVTANAMALAWGGQRGSATLTLPAEETIILQSSADCGTSGDRMRGHMWREIVATPGPTQLGQDNSLSAAVPWAVIGVSIKPSGGGPVPPGAFNVFETSTAAAAITGVIKTKIAGSAFSLDVVAISGGAQDAGFTDPVTVELLGNNTLGVSLDANNCPTTSTLVQTVSPNPTITAGRSTVSFAVAANSWRDVRVRVRWPTASPTVTSCSTDNVAIRPNTLASFAVTDTDWQTTGTPGVRALTDVTFGTVTHKAGRPLSVRATALNAAGTPAVTTNYTGAPTATLTACVGAACTASFGTLTLATTFAAGQLASDVASYNNVGSFALQLVDSAFASVDASDGSTTTERNITSATINVGRFVPDHFAVALNAPTFGTACGAGGFTYVGQVFNYTAQPVITVTAQDFANSTTTLYATSGSWWRITNASVTPATQAARYSAASGTLDLAGLPAVGGDPAIVPSGLGVGTLTFSSGTGLFFVRSTPVAPYDADISLAINVIDADGVILASNPARFGTATAGNGIAFNSGKSMRFGRLHIYNAYGSELVDLPMPMRVEYFSADEWVTHTADTCSSVGLSALANFQGNLSAGETCVQDTGSPGVSGQGCTVAGPLVPVNERYLALPSSGGYNLYLKAPAATNEGSVDVSANLAAKTWLRFDWDGSGSDDDPTGKATFGLYRGSPRHIYLRERY